MKSRMNLTTKLFCLLFCLCIVFPIFPTLAQETSDTAADNYAVSDGAAEEENLCEHHKEHDDVCSYQAAVPAAECTHIHDETCGYVEAVKAEPCTHEHDAECGYAEATEGMPCTYECKLCTCDCETDDPDIHATTCPAYTAPENPVCYCAEKCTKDTVNVWCDVCGVDGIETCKGEDTAAAYATKSVSYVECSWDGTKVVKTKKTVTATVLTNGTYGELPDEWYVVEGNVSIKADMAWGEPYISINHMNLILADGCNLTVEGTIKVNWPSSSINIYGQDNGTGKMKVVATGIENDQFSSCAGIGTVNITGGSYEIAGSMYIHGGNVEAIGTNDAAGIGGAKDRAGGDIWIYDGTVTAKGGNYGAGIGGGGGDKDNHGGNITIYGGTVNATGKLGGAGLGGGNNGAGGNIKIYGGTVNAKGADGGAGIGGGCKGSGGNIIIQSGSVTTGGNGIGCGNDGTGGSFGTGENGNAIINGLPLSDESDIANWSGIINGVVYGQQQWSGDFVWNGNLNFSQGAKLDVDGAIKITLDDGSVITSLKDLRIGGITLKEKENIYDDQKHIPEVLSVYTGDGITLEAGKHYSVSYWRDGVETQDFVSEGTITVRAEAISGSGYTGSIETTFKINDISIYLEDVVCVDSNPANGQRLFDKAYGYTGTMWNGPVQSDTEQYCIFKLPIPVKIGEYRLLSRNQQVGRWTDWTIYGSNSQEGPWTEIHKVVDAKLKTQYVYDNDNGPFVLPYETQAYQYYKIVINGSVPGTDSQSWYISEMYLQQHNHTWNCSTNDGVTTAVCVCGAEGTVTLDVPAMEKVTYGYAKPAAQKFSISESGAWNGIIDSITLSGTDAGSFVLDETNRTIQPKSGLNAKTHSANILVTYKDGHQISAPFTFTVDAADLKNVLVQQEGTLTYNTEPQTAQVKASGDAVNQQEIYFVYSKEKNGDYTETVPSFTEAGTHDVYYKALALNHKEYAGTFTVTIGKCDNTVHITGDLNKTYDAISVREPSYTAYGTGGVTIEYKKADADDSTYSTVAPIAAGDYVVRVTKAEDKNYFQGSATKEFTIEKAGLTVTAENKTVSYGDDAPVYTVTYDGLQETDTAASLGGTLTFDCSYKKFDDKGEYTITPKGYTSGNYDISYEKGILTVNPKSITVTIEAKKSIYGDETTALTAVTDGIVNNDEAVYELSTAANKTASVGKYDITGTMLDKNYSIEFAGEKEAYEITPRELTISVEVADKKYDGLDTAVITKAELVNIANEDAVSLQNGVATFETREVNQDINIEFTPFRLIGEDDVLKNYTLIQPTGITASITNDWNPVEGVDYKVSKPNGNGWLKEDFVIAAFDGYQISLDDSASGIWSDKLTYSDEADNETVTFYLKDTDDGTISLGKTVTYKVDKTPATGKVIFDERNGWESFVNGITFDLFYKDPVQVEVINLKDNLSDIESVEYVASGEAMTLREVEQLDGWEAMDGNVVGVDREDTKKFVYFIRITDKAGNFTYLSTNGAEYDTTPPVIAGVVDGGVYYTTQEVTITDKNLDVVTLNENPANNMITLVGNIDTTYTVKAADKAGTITTVTVMMKKISDLAAPMDALTQDNVNSEDSQTLEGVKTAVAAVDITDATDDEKAALQEILDKVDYLETVIEETANEMARIAEELQKYDSHDVNSNDVDALAQLTEDIRKLTDADNLSDVERAALGAQTEQIAALQEVIDKTTAENDRIADAAAGYDLSKVTSDDKSALEKLLQDIEKQMESTNLTEEERTALDGEKQAVTELLDKIKDTGDSMDQIDKGVSSYSKDSVKSTDKEALEQLIKDIDTLLGGENLTEDERNSITETRNDAVQLLDIIRDAAQAANTENIEAVKDITPENVKLNDKDALEKAKSDLEKALDEKAGNYTESETDIILEKLDCMTESLVVIDRVEDVLDLINNLPDSVLPDDDIILAELETAQKAYDSLSDYEEDLVNQAAKDKLDALLADAVAYELTIGDGGKWTIGSDETLTFHANGSYNKFAGIQIDEKEVEKKNYNVVNGSTVITLKTSYLETLKVGSHTLVVHYTDGSVTGTFSIEKATLTEVRVQQDGTLTYNTQSQTAAVKTNAVSVNDEPVVFTYSTEKTGTYTEEVPDFTIAGIYEVYYRAEAWNHHVSEGSFMITIEKQTVDEPFIQSKGYTGKVLTAELLDTELYTVEKNLGGMSKGAYDVVLKLTDSTNYKWSSTDNDEVILKFFITAVDNHWIKEPSMEGWIYGEKAVTPDYEAQFGTVKVHYIGTANDQTVWDASEPPAKAGEYKAVFVVDATEDYGNLYVEAAFAIEKADVTVTADNKEKTYGGNDPILTFSHTELVGDDVLSDIRLSRETGEAVGSYVITAVQPEGVNENYEVHFEPGVFVIEKAVLMITADNKTAVYGDAVPEYTVTYNGFQFADKESDLHGRLTFDCAYEQFSDKGRYLITPKGYTSNNYEICYVDGILEIIPKCITVTIEPQCSIYGDEVNSLTASDDGIVNNDVNVYHLETDADSKTNIGFYDIKGTATDGNYNITFVNEVDAYQIVPREVTISVTVADKQYDGLNSAEITSALLQNVAEGDEIGITNGTASFESVEPAENINIQFTPFALSGDEELLKNYILVQPEGITANIINMWTPSTEYTVSLPNEKGWLCDDFLITAQEGYLLSLSNTAEGQWTDRLTGSLEGENQCLVFYVKNKADGGISLSKTESYKLDKNTETSGTSGKVYFDERNQWESFLNTITFGLFYKDEVKLAVEAEDSLSGISTMEYVVSEKDVSFDEIKDITNWKIIPEEGVPVLLENGKQFVCYVRITDNAGNMTYLSTDGVEYDTCVPIINGVEDGGTYYTSQEVTISDKHLDTVLVNGESTAETFVLEGNKEIVYFIQASDKAGNTVSVSVKMQPISDITDAIGDLTDDTIRTDDKERLQEVLEQIEELLDNSSILDDEKTMLDDIANDIETLLDVIETAIDAAGTEAIEKVKDIALEDVKKEDKEDLEKAKSDLEKALEEYEPLYTEEEIMALEDILSQIDEALTMIENVETVEDMCETLPETLEPDDEDAIAALDAWKEAYDELTAQEQSLLKPDVKEKLYRLMQEAVSYRIIEGDGFTWTDSSEADVEIKANGLVNKFIGIQVDGVDVDKDAYEVKAGSTIIKLSHSYLKTLREGEHVLTVLYTDGWTNGTFIVKKEPVQLIGPIDKENTVTDDNSEVPDTGDSGNLLMWMMLLLISGGVFVTTKQNCRKE